MNTEPASQQPASLPPVITVSALNQSVARLLEKSFALAWITGEVSNFTRAASGHWYFTLKDNAAQVRAVMFRGRAQAAGFDIKNGDKIEARATVTLYAPRGDYQLNVEAIRHAGAGNLFEAFQRLKEKLAKEGLFDSDKKQPLPYFPRTIGIITSPQAAALRDVLTTLSRRAPHIRLILYPAPVQGEGAAEKIAGAILAASARAEADLLIICRGGGSMEDLWSFNEETVARAIAACAIPVISGVGHETDTTITDFVADLRAPTPTGAAEMATRPRSDWINSVRQQADNLRYAMERIMAYHRQAADMAARRLISPAAYIQREKIRLGALAGRLSQAEKRITANNLHQLAHWQTRLKGKWPDTAPHHTLLQTLQRQLTAALKNTLHRCRQNITASQAQLELLSPRRTLERGYAIITDSRGQIIRSPLKLPVRENVTIRLAQGSAQVGIASVQPELE
ncbi:MAG: exodeoxyribonuclease VII large subunit [Alistipes senegalensis]|nr:exodeoxyribonuclease VII large subunit [Oxalobacter formigenes]MCM1280253.1 exodeoxyribonuclease VII large subunit [Alistipes senegalensis]